MKKSLKQCIPHLLVILGFIAVALLYFSPVLSSKMLYQNDIKLYQSMAQQHTDFRATTGEETFWTNGAFGGMPTYQMGAHFPNDYMDKLDRLIRFLPRPADYVFLYLISFYILMLVMRVPWKYAVIGALAFGLSTYLIIIIGVGHNSKAHAVAYFPLVLAGVLLTFQKKYIWGFLLTAVAMGLEIQANHYQMTYYLGFAILIVGIAFLVDAIMKKQLPHFVKSVGILIVAVGLGLATNATTLLSTAEYAKTSIRGKQLLDRGGDASEGKKDGLPYGEITQWSYGKLESLNLLIPKFMGVGTSGDLGRESAFYKELRKRGIPHEEADYYAQTQARLYWGEQPFVEAPPYLGITVFLLGLLGLLIIKGRTRWWLIGGMAFSLLLSWGSNFDGLSRFFVDYVPLYNKFRAITSIQVILEFLLPIAAVIGLHRFFNDRVRSEEKLKKLLIATGVLGGLCLIIYLFGASMFNLRSEAEGELAIKQADILNALKADRKTLMQSDALRSLLFVLMIGGVLFLTLKKKVSENISLIVIGVLICIDLVGVDRRSVNEDNFISQREYRSYFEATEADKEILKDDGYYRVLDDYRGFNNSHAAYFFNSLNGYSAVRPRRMDDVYNQIAQGNTEIKNMLNVKYTMKNEEGKMLLEKNENANGPAWFVSDLKYVDSWNDSYIALAEMNTKNTAVIYNKNNEYGEIKAPKRDSLSTVSLLEYKPNKLVYEYNTSENGFLVFSEAYYKNGWVATIDDTEAPIVLVNYMLRGLEVPAGNHKVTFKFDPEVVKTGSSITLVSSILLLLLTVGAIVYNFRIKNKEELSVQ